jgi:hypothetical protein
MSKTLKKRDGDIVLQSSNGRPYYIQGIEKLSQDVPDALMTEYDPERGYGSQISNLDQINARRSGPLGLINRGYIKTLVREALERLQQLQNTRIDQLTGFEAIQSIGTIRVIQFSRNGYIFFVDVTPYDGPDVIPTSFFIQLRHQFLPGAKPNLPGSIVTDDTRAI